MVEDTNYTVRDPAPYDLGEEILKTNRRKKRAKFIIRITSLIIVAFVIISYLGYTIGQYFANATSLSVRTNMPEIRFAQVGFRLTTPIDATDAGKYNLQIDESGIGGPGYVYWTNQDVTPQTFSFVLRHEKYSDSSRLTPVTSRAFAKDQDKTEPIKLYDRPRVVGNLRHITEEGDADTQDYIGFKVLFRLLIDNDISGQVSLDNIGVYFARDTKFNGNQDLLKGMRLGFQSEHTKDIISPGRKEPKANNYLNYINVGGRLDLDAKNSPQGRFGYYDYTVPLDSAEFGETGFQQYEIAYGDFETPLTNANWGSSSEVAGVVPEDHNVYKAATWANVRPLVDAIPAKQYYTNFEKYTLINGVGDPISFTNEFGVTELDIKIWLEGWDPLATDKVVNATFGAQLKFEVAKKDLAS